MKLRVITGLVLAGILAAIVFLMPPFVYFAAMAFVCLAAIWEWTALAAIQSLAARVAYTACTGLLMAVLSMQTEWQFALLLISPPWWLLIFWLVLQYPSRAELWSGTVVMSVSGLFIILPSWSALLLIRQHAEFQFLFTLMIALVAFTDIGAYFTGRAFGRNKLAQRVSPNKTWEGFAGGVASSTLCMLAVGVVLLLHGDLSGQALLVLTAGAACLAMISVIGDLFESMCKRKRGVKDSGTLLPGHGGMLDRIDGFTAATPVFMLLVMLVEHL